MNRVLWGMIFVIALLTALLLTADKASAVPKKTAPDWENIARFYSGGNMRPGGITYDWTNTMGTTEYAGSGKIRLNPEVKKSLDAFVKYGPRSQQGMVLGMTGLSTLIHEALHNRANTPDFDPAQEVGPTDLGIRLIPDLIQRFFGVKMDSPWGKKYVNMVLKDLASRQPKNG